MTIPRASLAATWLAAAACGRPAPPPAPPTFNKDVAPIVFANCVTCHRPGQVAPFSLLTYADVVKHAETIVKETRARRMPPWLPDHGEFPIIGERRLRDDQVDAIARWVRAGTPEGAAADLPQAPSWPDGWQFGRPDLVLTPARPYSLAPSQEDVYRNLVIHTGLTTDVFVRAVEFRTGGAPIHHAVIRVDRTAASRSRDGQDGRPGFEGMAVEGVQDPEGQFIGWSPGRGPIVSPEGIPWRLQRGSDLVVELHLVPSKKPLVIQPTIALFFTDTPPARIPLTVRMANKTIDIPAGQRDYIVTDTYELPVPVDLMSVYPHAHYLGKDMMVTAALPDGTMKTLLHIPRWSFHWQQDYRYQKPIPLPRGTRVTMKYTYDNSDENDENPRTPPVRVTIGPKSTDEMAELGLQLMPQSPADAETIARDFDERERRMNIAMAEQRVRDSPGVAQYQAFLGGAYLEAGRVADAIPPLEAAIRLDPRLAVAQSDLGTALMEQQQLEDALAHLRQAVALAPRNETMFVNLGNALRHTSRAGEAAAAYRRALAINPDYLDAHVNLGSLLMSQGRVADALPEFEHAVALDPDSALLQTNLGSALAAQGRLGDAMEHVRRALELEPDYAPALDNFKRLQAMGVR